MKCIKCGVEAVGMITVETDSDGSSRWPIAMEGRCRQHFFQRV